MTLQRSTQNVHEMCYKNYYERGKWRIMEIRHSGILDENIELQSKSI